jgi:hypothetical protein
LDVIIRNEKDWEAARLSLEETQRGKGMTRCEGDEDVGGVVKVWQAFLAGGV